ncbi:hypothetical protein MKW98_008319, partial [Papaver atlanticum]
VQKLRNLRDNSEFLKLFFEDLHVEYSQCTINITNIKNKQNLKVLLLLRRKTKQLHSAFGEEGFGCLHKGYLETLVRFRFFLFEWCLKIMMDKTEMMNQGGGDSEAFSYHLGPNYWRLKFLLFQSHLSWKAS